MRVCLHKSYLGSDLHLLCDTDRSVPWRWASVVPSDAWVLGEGEERHVRDLRFLASCVGAEISPIPERFRRADEITGVEGGRHIHTVPQTHLLAHVRDVLRDAEDLEDSASDPYITRFALETRRQICDLCDGRVDPVAWADLMREDSSPALESFEPSDTGMVRAPVYDQMSSVTGRLTVSSGPQILTLRKDMRRIITPSRRGRRVLMVDFVSHEPRVALCMAGVDPPDDIYGWYRDEMMPTISRDDAKIAIIGTLYGMSSGTLSEKLNSTIVEARVISESVRAQFGIQPLERRLVAELREKGTIRSHFGRSIRPTSSAPGTIVNNYVQSTALDVGMMGFRRIADELASRLIQARFLYYIHDAAVLEVSERHEDNLREICEQPLRLGDDFPGSIRAKVKEVTE